MEEPEWVEVMVDILLSLLSQPSRHIRQVCKTVFSSICPHVTAAALSAILDVSNAQVHSSCIITTCCSVTAPHPEVKHVDLEALQGGGPDGVLVVCVGPGPREG